jgi:Transposase DDE domain
VVVDRAVPPGSAILSDRIGHLPKRLAASRRNPMPGLVRELRVTIETGKVLRIFTNDLEAGAQQIADLYKRRWAIELFFRWVKQTLKIGHFFGTSENAVRIQITAFTGGSKSRFDGHASTSKMQEFQDLATDRRAASFAARLVVSAR